MKGVGVPRLDVVQLVESGGERERPSHPPWSLEGEKRDIKLRGALFFRGGGGKRFLYISRGGEGHRSFYLGSAVA